MLALTLAMLIATCASPALAQKKKVNPNIREGKAANEIVRVFPYVLEDAFPGLTFKKPITAISPPDGTGRLFIVEQDGWVRVVDPKRGGKQKPHTFLDMSKLVQTKGWEEGLLGLAFHPDYKRNGQCFIYYTQKPQHTAVARLTVSKDDPNKADLNSLEDLLVFPQPYRNHNGGSIAFGPDGYLYIGLGDGGYKFDPHGHGQNLSTLLGSILRIDVNKQDPGKKYAVPKDNPFVSKKDAKPEIYAYGLRNVWQMSFDAKGQLWAADVGQDYFEEINLITKGGNYGWRVREGKNWFDKSAHKEGTEYIEPIWEYHHEYGKSITGGHVYNGKRLPELRGRYIYGDFVNGRIWGLFYQDGKVIENKGLTPPKPRIGGFGVDSEGEIYVLCFDDQKVYRFKATDAAIPKENRFE